MAKSYVEASSTHIIRGVAGLVLGALFVAFGVAGEADALLFLGYVVGAAASVVLMIGIIAKGVRIGVLAAEETSGRTSDVESEA